jgi:hypothetical protein
MARSVAPATVWVAWSKPSPVARCIEWVSENRARRPNPDGPSAECLRLRRARRSPLKCVKIHNI